MSEAKHTPGPWLREGRTVYALMFDSWKRGTEVFRNRFSINVQRDRECSEEEAEANARLIAAAPELLAAFEEVLDGIGFLTGGDWELEGFCISEDRGAEIRAILKKAKGEA